MRLSSTLTSTDGKSAKKTIQRAPARDRTTPSDEPSPAAKNLALAHHLQRLIDRGVIADYAQAARMLRVSQPRMTHLMSLLLLSPKTQEAILLGRIAPRDKELRMLARIAEWRKQEAGLSTESQQGSDRRRPQQASSNLPPGVEFPAPYGPT